MKAFEWGGWRFEPREWRLVSPAAGVVSLPNKSLQLLALLLDRAPRLVPKDQILSTVWPDAVVEEGNIAFHIALLRKTLDEPGGEASCIETVRGRGYRFIAKVEAVDTSSAAVWASEVAPAASAQTEAAPVPDATPPPPPVATTLTTRRRWLWHAAPVALVAGAVGVMGWLAFSAGAAVHEVTVLPAQVSDDRAGLPTLSDAIVSRVADETSLQVRAGSFSGSSETPVDAGRRLNTEAILTTRVDRSAGPWKVYVQLTRTRDAHALWSWVFEVPGGMPDPQSVIAGQIARGLGRHLDVASAAPAKKEALTLTLRGREAWALRTPPSVQQAISFYQRAIELDPAFAPAYTGLADCYNLTMSGLPVQVRAANAKANAERALALDPRLAEAHTSLAFALYKFEWRWKESEAAFRRAIALDPSYALAHHWYGEMLAYQGRFDEAIAELRQALSLEPNSLPILVELVGPLLHSGRVSEARALVERGAQINPTFHSIPRRMAEVLAAEGRERESLEEEWRTLVLTGATLESVEELRAAYRTGGRDAVLRVEIARLEAGGPGRFEVPTRATFLASKYAKLRDRAKSLQWIATAIDRREDIALHLPTYPEYHWLRDDPEFQRQIARLGLPAK